MATSTTIDTVNHSETNSLDTYRNSPHLLEMQFVLMLDPWLEVFPAQWPISGAATKLEGIRRIGQVDMGKNPRLIPRNSASAIFLENKSVIDVRTGRTVPGGIYQLTKKS